MMDYKTVYPAIFTEHENNEIVVTFPDIAEALTSGYTNQEAYEEAQDALSEALAARIYHNEDIPNPGTYENSKLIPAPLEIALKVCIYRAIKENKVTYVDLAHLMNCDEKQIRRLSDPYHHSTLPSIEKALKALGQKPEIIMHTVSSYRESA